MRRLLLFAVTACFAAATLVALASASRTAPHSSAVTPGQEAANAYLPAGDTPITDNWYLPDGDHAQTGFSQLKQITSSNVGGLKLVWTASLDPAWLAANRGIQNAPICCPDGYLIEPLTAGDIALNPATGTTAWKYVGPAYNTVRGSTNQVAKVRGLSYSPKLDYVFVGQEDGSIVALKAKTGAPIWTAQVSGAGTYGSATGSESQPFTHYVDDGGDGLVITAPNGGESPFRGHTDAYNAKTGALVWRNWATPDPTQLPYILTWGNPAEASQGGAAIWSIPAVDVQNKLVYVGTGNLYPWTGRQPGDDLWGTSLQAIDLRTGALRWYWQSQKHDIWDWDCPEPPSRFNVPINGVMTPVVVEACKNGIEAVLNAKNGGFIPHYTWQQLATYDPTGKGIALNGLSKITAMMPQGAVGCVYPIDMTQAGLTTCRNVTNGVLVAGTEKDGPSPVGGGTASLYPADWLQIAYGGTAPNPGQPGSYGINVQGANGVDPCPTCAVVNLANNRPIVGTTFGAAHTSAAYFAFGSTTNGPLNYPFKSYDPLTHNLYQCATNNVSAHSNAGDNSTNAASINGSTNDPRLFVADLQAINMTNNTFSWIYGSKANTLGDCHSGVISTAGNVVFQAFNGRTDQTAAQLALKGLTAGGTFDAFDATTGKLLWQWGIPGGVFGSHSITFMYKGKQYVAIYAQVGQGVRSDGGREEMAVFSL